MPNNYFRFKDFVIYQDKCTIKVCTDSCLFGAWIANIIGKNVVKPTNILDVGTGTGLLSLMLAQKTNAHIDAIEIDKDSFEQAKENFKNSPWHDRINAFHADIKNWQALNKYDLIISNPPFYENDLLSEDIRKNISKHSSALRLEDILTVAENLLTEDGYFAALLPSQRADWFEKKAHTFSFFVKEKSEVQQTTRHTSFRTMLILQRKQCEPLKSIVSIRNNNNEYTGEFTKLLKDYYLNL